MWRPLTIVCEQWPRVDVCFKRCGPIARDAGPDCAAPTKMACQPTRSTVDVLAGYETGEGPIWWAQGKGSRKEWAVLLVGVGNINTKGDDSGGCAYRPHGLRLHATRQSVDPPPPPQAGFTPL